MTQKIGPREQALRDAREKRAKSPVGFAKIVKETLASLPVPSGKKPVKRKAKRRAKK